MVNTGLRNCWHPQSGTDRTQLRSLFQADTPRSESSSGTGRTKGPVVYKKKCVVAAHCPIQSETSLRQVSDLPSAWNVLVGRQLTHRHQELDTPHWHRWKVMESLSYLATIHPSNRSQQPSLQTAPVLFLGPEQTDVWVVAVQLALIHIVPWLLHGE